MPSWLLSSGTKVLQRRFVRDKSAPICDAVELISANQTYVRVRTLDGHETTVSISDLAPCPSQENEIKHFSRL